MKLTIVSRSGTIITEDLVIDQHASVADLKMAFHRFNKKASPDRQRWIFEMKPLEVDYMTLSSYRITEGARLTFKDLGPQIGWQTVFLIEYAGPLVIYPLFYGFGHFVYGGKPVQHTKEQELVYTMLMFHFIKRELETLFVHRFSHGTMPLINVFKNSFHYWILSGVLVAWHVFGPGRIPQASETYESVCVGLYLFGQISNFLSHLTLRNLRHKGSKDRKIPYGYGFDLVSCPNYFFESLSWLAILMLTRSWAVGVFFIVAVGQMYIWAVKKHKNYTKEFKNYPKSRKAMFPFIA